MPSDRIIRLNGAATAVFAATATYAAAVFDTVAQWVGAATAMTLFAIGVVVFLWAFLLALNRSRYEQIAVVELYLLMGDATPKRGSRIMNLLLIAQAAIALATALARPDGPDGSPGSSLVVGCLVPVLGFGLNGLWAVTTGNFSDRRHTGNESYATEDEIRQNADHG